MKSISKKTIYIPTDGWRGVTQPLNAVGGANDTGGWEDSPCPSSLREKEISGFCKKLRQEGIKYKTMWCNSSNVFMARNYVLVHPEDHSKAYEIAKEYKDSTRLFYTVEKADIGD